MISLDVLTLSVITGAGLPLVTALLTKYRASSTVKATVNLVLTVLTGGALAITQAPGHHLAWQSVVLACFATYSASGSAYAHLWKPTGVTEAVAAVAPTVGLGTPQSAGAHSA